MNRKITLIAAVLMAAAAVRAQTYEWTGANPLSSGNYNTIQDNSNSGNNWVGSAPVNDSTGDYVFDSANLLAPSRTTIRESRTGITRTSMLFAMDNPVWNDPAVGGGGWVSGFYMFNNGFNLAGNVTVNSGHHTIANAVTQTVNTAWSVANGSSMTVSGVLSGGYGVTKTGGGTLALSAVNTFSGGLNINGGTVAFSTHDNRLGAAGTAISIDGGTLSKTGAGDITSARIYTIGSGGATFNVAEGRWANTGVSGERAFDGSGDIIKTGDGTFYVNQSDSRSDGNVIIEGGTYEFSLANRIRTDAVITIHNGATLENSYGSAGVLGFSTRSIVLDDGTGTLKNSGLREITLGDISGAGMLNVEITAGGNFELVGNNTYEGGTSLSTGTLVGNAANAFGTGGMTVADGAALILRRNDTISDLAALVLGSSSTLNLDFTGNETVGSLSLDGGTTWLDPNTYNVAALGGLGDGTYLGTGSITVIPEPATIGMLLFGALTTMFIRRARAR